MKKVILGLLGLGLAVLPGRATLLTNGSFEQGPSLGGGGNVALNPGDLPGWTLQPTAEAGSAGKFWWYMSGGGTWGVAQDGSRFMNPTFSDQLLSQSFPVTAGRIYTVSYYVANRQDGAGHSDTLTNWVSLAAGSASGTLSQLASNSLGNTTVGNWQQYGFSFSPDTTTTATLNFQFLTGSGPGYPVLDNVMVLEVPEPSVLLLFLVGLGLVLGKARAP